MDGVLRGERRESMARAQWVVILYGNENFILYPLVIHGHWSWSVMEYVAEMLKRSGNSGRCVEMRHTVHQAQALSEGRHLVGGSCITRRLKAVDL